MKLTDVKSSMIKAIGHHGTTMRVQFKGGGTYEYSGISSEQHAELMAAPSIGKHLNKVGIKGKKL